MKRLTRVEKELCGVTKIFGESYGIEVIYIKIENPELNLYGKKIILYLPYKYKKVKNTQILKIALEKMYDEIARVEIENIMEETRIMLKGLAPENYKIKRMSNKLAKTLEDRTIIINPEVVKYNKDILRYIILREFCHLKYKRCTKKFWNMIEEFNPYYEQYENMLKIA